MNCRRHIQRGNGDCPHCLRESALNLLDGIEFQLRRLRSRLAPKERNIIGADAMLKKLLPAIGGKFGSNFFTTAEVLEDPALRALVDGMFDVQNLGIFLRESANRPIGNFLLQLGPRKKSVRLFRVIVELPRPPKVLPSDYRRSA